MIASVSRKKSDVFTKPKSTEFSRIQGVFSSRRGDATIMR